MKKIPHNVKKIPNVNFFMAKGTESAFVVEKITNFINHIYLYNLTYKKF